jgi:cell division septal protein FtsQ
VINKTILALNQKYGNVGVQLDASNYYWSSSEYSDANAWHVYMSNGRVSYGGKSSYGGRVRAFLRL